MAATNVTGVGPGAAHNSRGPSNGREVYVPLNGPHVVAAGSATTAGGGTVTVTFANPLTGGYADYSVVLVPYGGSTVARVTTRTDDSDGNWESFVITGHASTAHGWVVVKNGQPVADLA